MCGMLLTIEVHHGDVEGHEVVVDLGPSDGPAHCKDLAALEAQLALDSSEQQAVGHRPPPGNRTTAHTQREHQ